MAVDEGEVFIRDATQKRGIDPDIAVRVARSEGGTMPPGNVGKFETGWSFWPYQLHYGGPEYPQYGTVAGMGNGFTKLTGWAAGDPRAWRDSTRYALNQAKLGGWTPWYGAAHVGISQWQGINREHAWNASSETWDYEAGVTPMPAPVYNRETRLILQNDDWSCWPTSARMALEAWGRAPKESWIEPAAIRDGIVSIAQGLLVATGEPAAAWLTRQYSDPSEGTPTIKAQHAATVSFDDVKSIAGRTALLLGGRRWGPSGHWAFVRDYDAASDQLHIGNPANNGPVYGGQTMTRQQFDARGPFSMIAVTADGATVTPPPPPPGDPRDAEIASLKRDLDDARMKLGVASVDYVRGLRDLATALEALKP